MRLVTRLTIMSFVLAACASVLLYNTSYKVQSLKTTQRALDADIVAEQNAIRVLQAEWAYLAEPSRIERLAGTHLAMKKIDSAKMGIRIQTASSYARGEQVQVAAATKTKTPAAPASAPVKVAAAKPMATPVAAKVAPASQDSVQLLLASFRQQ